MSTFVYSGQLCSVGTASVISEVIRTIQRLAILPEVAKAAARNYAGLRRATFIISLSNDIYYLRFGKIFKIKSGSLLVKSIPYKEQTE